MIRIKKAELAAKLAMNEATCLKKIAAEKYGIYLSGKSVEP